MGLPVPGFAGTEAGRVRSGVSFVGRGSVGGRQDGAEPAVSGTG
ncbi:hypothetical protein ACFPN7_03565 [Amycolatopsis halotolerans]